MKGIFRVLIFVILIIGIGYFMGFDYKGQLNAIIGKNDKTISSDNVSSQNGQATMPGEQIKEAITNNKETNISSKNTVLDGMLSFIRSQKEGSKLVKSYRTEDKGYKDLSYIYDNALAVIALVNEKSGQSEALDILKNIAALQNKDGSWYDVYYSSGQAVKTSGKANTSVNTANTALMLYSYCYYTNTTSDRQFINLMKKCSDYLLTKKDEKGNGIYDSDISSKGVRSLKAGVFSYYGLREYAISRISDDYNEFKDKLFAAQAIASWSLKNMYNKGMFLKEYGGSTKNAVIDLDSQVLGCMLLKSSGADTIKYESDDIKAVLTKLNIKTKDVSGYKIDDNSKNSTYIWCRGTCSVPLAFTKLGDYETAENEADKIKKMYEDSKGDDSTKGIQLSTNNNSKIDMVNFESSGSCSWGIISMQCIDSEEISKICFGNEEEVFKKTTNYIK